MAEPDAKRGKFANNGDVTSAAVDKHDNVETQKVLKEIDGVQDEIDSINDKASEEIMKIEQKYNQMRMPHFEKRNEHIKKIPNFWATAFVNHPLIGKALESEDEKECIRYLAQIEVEEFEDIKSGFRLKFFFDSNPYFENAIVVKEFSTVDDPKIKTPEVKWKKGMKKLGRRANASANANGVIECSFFGWLCYDYDPVTDEFAEVIKDDIWPNPVHYFLTSDVEDDDSDDSYDDDLAEDGLDELEYEEGAKTKTHR